VEATSRLNVT